MVHFSLFVPYDQYLLPLKNKFKKMMGEGGKHTSLKEENATAAVPKDAVHQLWFNPWFPLYSVSILFFSH